MRAILRFSSWPLVVLAVLVWIVVVPIVDLVASLVGCGHDHATTRRDRRTASAHTLSGAA